MKFIIYFGAVTVGTIYSSDSIIFYFPLETPMHIVCRLSRCLFDSVQCTEKACKF